MSQHEPFCLYPHTADRRDLRPVACGACTAIWDRGRANRQERTCWGLERGSAANGIVNLIWLGVIIAGVVIIIVADVR